MFVQKPVSPSIVSTSSTDTNKMPPLPSTPEKKPTINPGAFKSSTLNSSSNILSSQQEQTLHQEIENFNPKTLKANVERVPSPKFMQKAQEMGLDLSPKQERLTSLEKAKIQYLNDQQQDSGLEKNLNSQTLEQFKRIDASSLQDQIIRPGQLNTLLGQHFEGFEHDLRSKLVNSNKVCAKASEKALQLISQTSPDSQLLLTINTIPQDQLRSEISAFVGKMRADRYGDNATYDQLSPKKQQLVNAIINGLEQGAALRQIDTPAALKDQSIRAITHSLQGVAPNSDVAVGWSLKSSSEIQVDFAIAQGWTTPQQIKTAIQNAEMSVHPNPQNAWIDNLSPFQKDVLNQVSEGITSTLDRLLPNRVSGMQNLTATVDGSSNTYSVPTTFTLNGQTYNTPKFLGKGGVGLILEYSNSSNPSEKVVVKSLLEPEKRNEMVREIIAHRHILGGENMQAHPNIVNLRGIVKGPQDGLFMVMDKAEGGNLQAHTNSLGYMANHHGMPKYALNLLTQHYLREAALGMQAAFDKGVMHNDVKGLNFLMHNGHVLASDFGSTHTETTMTKAQRPDTTYVSSDWNKQVITQKNDMYAMGVMIHMLNGGSPPGFDPLKPDPQDTTALGRLKNGLLAEKPEDRITPEGILESAYVKNLNTVSPHLMNDLIKAADEFGRKVGGKLDSINTLLIRDEHAIQQNQLRMNEVIQKGGTPNPQTVDETQKMQTRVNDLKLQREQLLNAPDVKAAYQKLLEAAEIIEKRTKI